MTTTTAPLSDKEIVILNCALELLKETGDAGLTMRKLADRADMRLSNVQYYFKSRDDVLMAMATRYFADCTQQIRALTAKTPGATLRDRTRALVQLGLHHGDELSDMCRIFRELWAISSRNDAIRDHMLDYYRTFSELVADFVLGDDADLESRTKLISLLIPFIEGYSVTAAAMPLSTDDVAEMITDIAVAVGSRPGTSTA